MRFIVSLIIGVAVGLVFSAPMAAADDLEVFASADLGLLEPCTYVAVDPETLQTRGPEVRDDGSCTSPAAGTSATIRPFPPRGDSAAWGELTVGIAYGGTTIVCVTVDPDALPPDVDRCWAVVCAFVDEAACSDAAQVRVTRVLA